MEEFYVSSGKKILKFICKNGNVIHIDERMLLKRTKVFKSMGNDHFHNVAFDEGAFKTFLNVLMEFEELTSSNALVIFPIAFKYNFQDLVYLCASKLQPSVFSETTILILNLAAEYECDNYLLNRTLNFLLNYGMEKIFVKKELYLLLEPKALLVLIKCLDIDFELLNSIKDWGINYLAKNNINDNLHDFLLRNNITTVLKLENVLSEDSVLKLYEHNPKRDLFLPHDYLFHLKKISKCSQFYGWEDVVKINETFYTKSPIFVNNAIIIKVILNPIIFFDSKDNNQYIKLAMTIHGYNNFENIGRGIRPDEIVNVFEYGKNENVLFVSDVCFLRESKITFRYNFAKVFIITKVSLNFEFLDCKSEILRLSFKCSQGKFLIDQHRPYLTRDIIMSKKCSRPKGNPFWVHY